VEKIISTWLGFLRGVFLANHLAVTDNLTRTTKRQNTYQCTQKVTLINNNTLKNYTKRTMDRAWFSRILRNPARKWSGSILTTPEPAQGSHIANIVI